MLVASQDEAKDGSFDADPDYIQRVAYLNDIPDFTPLINRGFLEMLADASGCLQKIPNGVTETEKSREEKETDPEQIFQIAHAHPKASHYRNELELPPVLTDAILKATHKDGEKYVLKWTLAWASDLQDPKFAKDPVRFFNEFQYRPEAWQHERKSGGKLDDLDALYLADAASGEQLDGSAGRSNDRQRTATRIPTPL